jgi:hypothetical protein
VRYLTIDGMLSGTGIRNSVEGGYIEPTDLGLSETLIQQIGSWRRKYETAHYQAYVDEEQLRDLDDEGLKIATALRDEVPDAKVDYYSNALMRRLT